MEDTRRASHRSSALDVIHGFEIIFPMPLALAVSRDMPLYPFGHGLSYTGFGYSNLLVSPGDVDSGASVDVDNTGQAPRILPSVLYLVRESSSSQTA
jgi:hypothetical protein